MLHVNIIIVLLYGIPEHDQLFRDVGFSLDSLAFLV